MLILVINLDRSIGRLTFMRRQIERLGLSFERVPAIDGLNVPTDLARYFSHIARSTTPIIDDAAVGCYASHLKAYQRIVALNAPYALILEDDALLPDDITDIVCDTLYALPQGWDLVQLATPHRHAIKPLSTLPCGGTLIRYSRVPHGAVGYLIRRSGAEKLLSPAIRRQWAIDTDTRRPWLFGLDVYGVTPNPIRHGSFPTTMGRVRKSARRGLPRPTRLTWTNQPLRTLRGFAFNLRKLGVTWWARCFLVNCAAKLGV